eukprot:TRINITY_DN7217_c0_g1_i1.p1 TRINITY_DN7217_c0_g1~~TRINITY_DN7217_c0_g1_i1.p1  ORF type:complete len:107 (+),score=8.61 TRINITY_DN7217_c0_g1_i1:394-714(+)
MYRVDFSDSEKVSSFNCDSLHFASLIIYQGWLIPCHRESIESTLAAQTLTVHLALQLAATEGYPASTLRSLSLEWLDPTTPLTLQYYRSPQQSRKSSSVGTHSSVV